MLKRKLSEEIHKLFNILGNKDAIDLLYNTYFNKRYIVKDKELCQTMADNKLIEIIDLDKKVAVNLTDLGIFFAQIIVELDKKRFNPVRAGNMMKTKFSREDFVEFYNKPLDVKILKLQSALAIMLRDKSIIMDINYNTKSNEFRLLKRFLDKAIVISPFEHKSKTKHKISCKIVDKNPEILNEWLTSGCYNSKSLVSYPLAFWTQKDIDECWDKMKDM